MMKILDRKREYTSVEIISWWEALRIFFNIAILIILFVSFYISYVNIPLMYIIILININLLYTLGETFELLFLKRISNMKFKIFFPKYFALIYFSICTIYILQVAIFDELILFPISI
jgi:hypothetical protein